MPASRLGKGPLLRMRSRAATPAGVAVAVALHAAVIAGLWRPARAPTPAPEAVTMVALSPSMPPAPRQAPAAAQPRAAPQRMAQRRPATATAPPAGAAAAGSAPAATGTAVPPAYFGALEALIRSALVYPPGSIARGEEGICKVRVSFSRDGTINGTQLAQDSGHAALDGECREVFRRIGRFPPVPPDTSPGAMDFSLELPITYSLQ